VQFREDINALRAIAVISVVLFHFNDVWLPGGFAGVDVFFVISGFLMTKIIIEKHEQNAFSISQFYLARANRIIPPFAVLCLALTILGWFVLTPIEYSTLGLHISSSLTFVSNFVFWKESGYFEAGSHEKWLLHTWSLSVEWQFYILYPIALALLMKFTSMAKLKALILASAILSLLLSMWATDIWPTPSYYLLPTRAWELLIGGLAYLYPYSPRKSQQNYMVWGGVTLLILSFVFLTKHTPWPSSLTVLPVLATYLIIQARSTNHIVFTNIISQKLGSWSYSIYLWHWPIAVAIYTFSLGSSAGYLGILLSILCGYISYRFVEQAKFSAKLSLIDMVKSKPVTLMLFTAGLGYAIHYSEGVSSSYRSISNTEEAKYLAQYHIDNYRKVKKAATTFDKNKQSGHGGIFIWGDSHAHALSYGIRETFTGVTVNQVTAQGCRPLVKQDTLTTGSAKRICDKANKKAISSILNIKPDVILLVQRRRHDENDFREIKRHLTQQGINAQIILVGPVPQWQPSLPNTIAKRHFDPNERVFYDPSFVSELFNVNDMLKQTYKDSDILHISLLDKLCEERRCLAKIDHQNTPLVWDYGHLSLEGSVFVVENILKQEIARFL